MKLSDIRRHLSDLQMEPSKSLGQNFLHDQNLAQWMIGQLEMRAYEQVIEIGPGLGALTEYLVPHTPRLTAIEKDGRLANFLGVRFPEYSGFQVRHEDACRFDTRTLFPAGPAVLIGNLPYYVSTAIILNFLSEPSPIRAALFTLQREVAERLSAAPGTGEYGSLSIAIQRRWKVKYLRTLPASVFYPEPKVESAVVLLTARPPSEREPVDGVAFERLVRQGFSQRRKQVRKTLALEPAKWACLAALIGCTPTARAEELSIDQWIKLVKALCPDGPEHAQLPEQEQFDVVDAEDRVVSQASRAEIHARDWQHRAVHIFIFNAAGELFLQKRSHLKDREPGKWDSSAAGHLDARETYDAAAAREIVEELGVEADLEFVGKLPPSANTGHEFIHLYRAQHEGPFQLHPAEIETGAFFPVDLLRSWLEKRPQDFAPGFLECMALRR